MPPPPIVVEVKVSFIYRRRICGSPLVRFWEEIIFSWGGVFFFENFFFENQNKQESKYLLYPGRYSSIYKVNNNYLPGRYTSYRILEIYRARADVKHALRAEHAAIAARVLRGRPRCMVLCAQFRVWMLWRRSPRAACYEPEAGWRSGTLAFRCTQ